MATPDYEFQDQLPRSTHPHRVWRGLGIVIVLGLVVLGSFELVYAGKIMPGVTANGVYLGGLDKAAAVAKLNDATSHYAGGALSLSYGNAILHIPVASLGVSYDNARAADVALAYGRQGGFTQQLVSHVRALVGRSTAVDTSKFDDAKLSPYIVGIVDDTVTPVADATLTFNNDTAQVTPATPGTRVDIGRLTGVVAKHVATTDLSSINVTEYQLQPLVDTAALQAATSQANRFVSAPITLTSSELSKTIDQSTIISWLSVNHKSTTSFFVSHKLEDLYPGSVIASISLNRDAIGAYANTLTSSINRDPQNAVLAMQNGALTVVTPSHDGIKLDEQAMINDITTAVNSTSGDRSVALKIDTAQADVREDNLASLGIKDQLSEGQTFFPGSSSARLTNVRAGASKFNDVLLKPGQQFSFGALLGEVDASTGYVPELVILGDHEEKQYGGGLCQVSSTAYRAALLAGLPINERVNHSFAISFYTAPYGVPGVDATIYYPQVDFKFTNDTGAYILIQTHMEGTTLTFDYYGTKTKSGIIRGPQFVSGSSDATQPSHTVFYRDVLDLAGNVVKTDKVDTYYESSLNFPVKKQYN